MHIAALHSERWAQGYMLEKVQDCPTFVFFGTQARRCNLFGISDFRARLLRNLFPKWKAERQLSGNLITPNSISQNLFEHLFKTYLKPNFQKRPKPSFFLFKT